jgi:hypothetical protein
MTVVPKPPKLITRDIVVRFGTYCLFAPMKLSRNKVRSLWKLAVSIDFSKSLFLLQFVNSFAVMSKFSRIRSCTLPKFKSKFHYPKSSHNSFDSTHLKFEIAAAPIDFWSLIIILVRCPWLFRARAIRFSKFMIIIIARGLRKSP